MVVECLWLAHSRDWRRRRQYDWCSGMDDETALWWGAKLIKDSDARRLKVEKKSTCNGEAEGKASKGGGDSSESVRVSQ